jgi:acetyl-CoA acetyltransferase
MDAAIGTTWRVSVAKKIPSQPVAAIRLLSKAGVKPERYCMDPFIEADDITLKTWLESSIEALESFTMNNAKEELFRCECLGEIKSEYADFSQK